MAGSPVDAAVDEFLDGAAALLRELVVVLDDLHAVTSEECLACAAPGSPDWITRRTWAWVLGVQGRRGRCVGEDVW